MFAHEKAICVCTCNVICDLHMKKFCLIPEKAICTLSLKNNKKGKHDVSLFQIRICSHLLVTI